jgi:hypothetical protein
LAVIAVSVMP